MNRLIPAVLWFLLVPFSAVAQDSVQPIIRTVLESSSAVPGQPVILRLTILVPTWMPQSPELPSYDLPNLMVRLPERSTRPARERVNGNTWFGISRAYRLYPLVAGAIQIPSQEVRITFADPKTRAPITVELQTDAVVVSGVIPDDASGLDPFIAATGLELEQTIEGDLADLEPGAAVTRRLHVRVDGASPMIIPPMLDAASSRGLSIYVQEPVLEENYDSGSPSGSRLEQITYVAETGGRFAMPPVLIRWYNLAEGRIESAEVEGFEMAVRGPAPPEVEPSDWRTIAGQWAPIILGLAGLGVVMWRLWPLIAAWRRKRYAAYLASDEYAFEQAREAIKNRRLGAAIDAAEQWWRRRATDGRPLPVALASSFVRIGASLYRHSPAEPSEWAQQWAMAGRALRAVDLSERAAMRQRGKVQLSLLNPGAPSGRLERAE
jgi:hypothetical protein